MSEATSKRGASKERERERERESEPSEEISLHGREWVSQKMGETKFSIFLQIELREKDKEGVSEMSACANGFVW